VHVVSLYVKTQNDVDLAVVEARMTYSLKVLAPFSGLKSWRITPRTVNRFYSLLAPY